MTNKKLYKYNPDWATCFDRQVEKVRINVPRGIKCYFLHCGSTSIPGCYTSDVIDIAVGASSKLDLITIRDRMIAAGYHFVQERSKLHFYVLEKRINKTASINLYIMQVACETWHNMMIFKNHMLHNYTDVIAYNQLRLEILKLPGDTEQTYQSEKIKFQKRILAFYK